MPVRVCRGDGHAHKTGTGVTDSACCIACRSTTTAAVTFTAGRRSGARHVLQRVKHGCVTVSSSKWRASSSLRHVLGRGGVDRRGAFQRGATRAGHMRYRNVSVGSTVRRTSHRRDRVHGVVAVPDHLVQVGQARSIGEDKRADPEHVSRPVKENTPGRQT